MFFQIKDFASVSASLANLMRATTRKVTDFGVGSVTRSLLDASAAEIDELYQRMVLGLRESIPVATYNSFDFAALAAAPASGTLVASLVAPDTPILIAARTVFSSAAARVEYESIADITVPVGASSVNIPVVARLPGTIGNLAAGQSFRATPVIPNITAISNPAAFANGADAETPEARKIRFNAFIQTLSRGTGAALVFGAKTHGVRLDAAGAVVERVVTMLVNEPWRTDPAQPVGLVRCFIHNGVGSTTAELVSNTSRALHGYRDAAGRAVPGWKAAGIRLEVIAATERAVNVTGDLVAAAGFDKPTLLSEAVREVRAHILGREIGESVLRANLIFAVMAIQGVQNFTLSAPAADVTALDAAGLPTIKLMPGVISIT